MAAKKHFNSFLEFISHPLFVGVVVLVLNIVYTNYKFDQDNKTKLLVSCAIPSNSFGYSDPQLYFLNIDVMCRITNISMKKVAIDKIESGNTDSDIKLFNKDDKQKISSSNTTEAILPQELDINQQVRYLVQIRIPLYGMNSAKKCLTTTKQPISVYAKCFVDNKISVNKFPDNIETLPNLAVKVTTTDKESFITKVSLKGSFYLYDEIRKKWVMDLEEPLESWPYPNWENK